VPLFAYAKSHESNERMTRTTVTCQINAPVERVFDVISDMRNFSKALPHITHVEFLTEQKSGLGTRFRETRTMNGKEHQTELEVTEFEPNGRIRMVAEQGGTIWDSLFTVTPGAGGTELKLEMDAIANGILAKVMNVLIKRMVQKQIERDLDGVKAYCER